MSFFISFSVSHFDASLQLAIWSFGRFLLCLLILTQRVIAAGFVGIDERIVLLSD